jgi:DnaJ-class molecular chaperone with C-terminal Zn finger domain
MNIQKDYYEILEVHQKASPEVIRRAYLVLAKKFHPDTQQRAFASANQRMQDINEAYQVLSDPVLRAQYDKSHFSTMHSRSTDSKAEPDPAASTMSELTILHNEIANKCKNLIDEHKAKIVKDDAHALANRVLCERLFACFNEDVRPLFVKIQVYRQRDFSAFQDAMTWGAAALFTIGVGYTWANDFIKAEMLLTQALGLHPDPKMTKQIFEVYNNLRKNAESQDSRQTASSQNTSALTKSNLLRIAGATTMLVLFVVVLIASQSPGNAPKSANKVSPPSAIGQKSVPTIPAKPAFTPILDKPTGYDPDYRQQKLDGYCQVTVDNTKNDYPVLVRLYTMLKGDESTRFILTAFYIQKGETFSAKNIPAGTYDIRYKNLKNGATSKTPHFDLEERETTSGLQYSVVTFTLFTVPSGNIKMTSIPEEDF